MADDEQHRPSLDRLESSSSFHSAFEYDPSAGLHMSGSLHSITERDFPTRELRRLESHALADGSSEAASAGTSEPAGTPTPSTPSGKHAGGLLVRTDTASLHVMAHDVLRVQLMELAKEKAALVEAMRELELREVLLLEEIKQEEEMLGDEIIAAGVLEDEAFDERDDAYAGLVEQYRNILVGYNAIKNSTTVEECVNYIAGLEAVEQVPLERVVEGNGRWVKSRGWHLAGSHHGNSSQLYRLLAEEVGELLAELDKGRSKTAAHEAGDVLAYALQFVWEFDLGGFFPPEGKDTRFWVDLDQSFAQLQCRKVEDIRAGRSKGLVELRDVLLRLHRCAPRPMRPCLPPVDPSRPSFPSICQPLKSQIRVGSHHGGNATNPIFNLAPSGLNRRRHTYGNPYHEPQSELACSLCDHSVSVRDSFV